jgi:DnaJ-class molecular chaperone
LALNKHPDRNSRPEATKEFQDLNSAYEYLIDILQTKGGSKRRKYRKTRRHTKRHRKTTHS